MLRTYILAVIPCAIIRYRKKYETDELMGERRGDEMMRWGFNSIHCPDDYDMIRYDMGWDSELYHRMDSVSDFFHVYTVQYSTVQYMYTFMIIHVLHSSIH